MNGNRKTNLLRSFALLTLAMLALSAPNGFAQTCGNGVVEQGEQCDDGGMSGGCCTAECMFAPAEPPVTTAIRTRSIRVTRRACASGVIRRRVAERAATRTTRRTPVIAI